MRKALEEAERERLKAEEQTQMANEMAVLAEGNFNRAEAFSKRAEEASLRSGRNSKRAFYFAVIAFLGLIISTLSYYNSSKAEKRATTESEKAKKALEEKEIAEFEDVLRRANNLLSTEIRPSCPPTEMVVAIDSMRIKYPKNNVLQERIKDINLKRQLIKCN